MKKELVMTKENNEDSRNSTKCQIRDNDYFDNDVKVRNHCRITGKYRDSAHGDCNIDVKLNHKSPVLFYNLQNHDYHLIFQELNKLSLVINDISNGLEKYKLYHQ